MHFVHQQHTIKTLLVSHMPGLDDNCTLFLPFVVQGAAIPDSAGEQPSALLHCLYQLNTDTWAQVMMPKLVEHKSAADVALSCSQLRDLCYSSRQILKIGLWKLGHNRSQIESHVQSLPTNFPNCTVVSLGLNGMGQSYDAVPAVLPALER
jgi:hypothetical protein